MTVRLAEIRVALDHGHGIAGGLPALLSEIVQRLEGLAAGEAQEPIDLRSLPLNAAERERLAATLGDGEIDLTLELDGRSHVRETATAGVWWIEHRDARGEVIAELLEIARVPEILNADAVDIMRGARALRRRIAVAAGRAAPEDAP